MLDGKSPTWRDDIDALAFQPANRGDCMMHRRAFRTFIANQTGFLSSRASGERCAGFARRRSRRAHSLSPNLGRTASPICPDLIYDRHSQVSRFQICNGCLRHDTLRHSRNSSTLIAAIEPEFIKRAGRRHDSCGSLFGEHRSGAAPGEARTAATVESPLVKPIRKAKNGQRAHAHHRFEISVHAVALERALDEADAPLGQDRHGSAVRM
jgi:hypothetical protein